MERLDKDDYLEEERVEADEIYEQRKQKEIEEANILTSMSQVNSNHNEEESITDGTDGEKNDNHVEIEE